MNQEEKGNEKGVKTQKTSIQAERDGETHKETDRHRQTQTDTVKERQTCRKR